MSDTAENDTRSDAGPRKTARWHLTLVSLLTCASVVMTTVPVNADDDFAGGMVWNDPVCTQGVGGGECYGLYTASCENAHQVHLNPDHDEQFGLGGAGQATASCEGKRCWGWQQWEVKGEASASIHGSYKLRLYVQCGGTEISICWLANGPDSCHGALSEGSGSFGCHYTIESGREPEEDDWSGKCVDPANPNIAYRAIPAGQVYDAAANLIRLDDDGNELPRDLAKP